MFRRILWIAVFVWGGLILAGCTRSAYGAEPWQFSQPGKPVFGDQKPVKGGSIPTTAPSGQQPVGPDFTPTPDPPRVLPTPRMESEQYVVQRNDSLGVIAQRYGVSLQQIINANQISNPDILEVGQVLTIPASEPMPTGPDGKIIPDSELVYGPNTVDFDVAAFVKQKNGFLNHYQETIAGRVYDGPGVVMRVAQDYSVNPRLLLAVLEYQSGWVTKAGPPEGTRDFPIGLADPVRKNLYRQLAWAANNLNRGYYLWRVNGLSSFIVADGRVVPVAGTLNAGTAGVQQFFALLLGYDDWLNAVGDKGLLATYEALFGSPFSYAFEPLIPADLSQPAMQLPFEPGNIWSYTGGPHGGWADGSAWAALDFAPPGEALGCVQSNAWEVAVADGVIARSDLGEVILDLDGDGKEQTGWTLLYMHVETRDRVPVGTVVKAGDRIGHPSCEGGVSTGTHLHLARKYNGEWISADGAIPFNMEGWVSRGDGAEYNGFLEKNGVLVEAWEGRREVNQISR